MERIVLARVVYGAKLFGLETDKSDEDFVSIVLPSARDIVLCRDINTTLDGSTSDNNTVNTSSDIDEKQIPLHKFVEGLKIGSLDCLEVLNAPLKCHEIHPHVDFMELRSQREEIASKNATKILGFCRNQAKKYNSNNEILKGAVEVEAALRAIGIDGRSKEKFEACMSDVLHMCDPKLVSEEIVSENGGRQVRFLNISGKKVSEKLHASRVLDIVIKLIKKFGSDVCLDGDLSPRDWKSLSHAVRIAQEGREYVTTGKITLPIPDKETILGIKLGRYSLKEVDAMLSQAISEFENAIDASPLPELPPEDYLDELVYQNYKRHIGADMVMSPENSY